MEESLHFTKDRWYFYHLVKPKSWCHDSCPLNYPLVFILGRNYPALKYYKLHQGSRSGAYRQRQTPWGQWPWAGWKSWVGRVNDEGAYMPKGRHLQIRWVEVQVQGRPVEGKITLEKVKLNEGEFSPFSWEGGVLTSPEALHHVFSNELAQKNLISTHENTD